MRTADVLDQATLWRRRIHGSKTYRSIFRDITRRNDDHLLERQEEHQQWFVVQFPRISSVNLSE